MLPATLNIEEEKRKKNDNNIIDERTLNSITNLFNYFSSIFEL